MQVSRSARLHPDSWDIETISQLAELGVIFLMFGVGLHFSLRDLWAVRDTAIPGAIAQMLIATGLGFALTQLWGWSVPAGLVLGLAISVASTVVLLRGLMDNGLMNTSHGKVAVGWLVLEDLATVLILVLLPALFSNDGGQPPAHCRQCAVSRCGIRRADAVRGRALRAVAVDAHRSHTLA